MRITINLATRPFADLGPIYKRLRISMAVFAVVSIGLGVGLHFLHTKAEAARAREHSLDGQIAGVNHERQGYEVMMRQPDNAQVLEEANNLNRLFDQKAFSWTLAMEDLETVLPGGVQVTTLEPIREDKTARITLRLRVVGPRDKALELVQNLEHSRHFLRPVITGESTENAGGPGTPLEPVSATNKVNFDMLSEFNPATLSESAPAPEPKKVDAILKTTPAASPSAATPPTVQRVTGQKPAGPGLRRPPMTGVSQPPPVPQSPTSMRRAGQRRYPTLPQSQQAPPQAAKPGPGGRQ